MGIACLCATFRQAMHYPAVFYKADNMKLFDFYGGVW
jgi:hypothetical protein